MQSFIFIFYSRKMGTENTKTYLNFLSHRGVDVPDVPWDFPCRSKAKGCNHKIRGYIRIQNVQRFWTYVPKFNKATKFPVTKKQKNSSVQFCPTSSPTLPQSLKVVSVNSPTFWPFRVKSWKPIWMWFLPRPKLEAKNYPQNFRTVVTNVQISGKTARFGKTNLSSFGKALLQSLSIGEFSMSFLQPNLEPLWTPWVGNVWCPFAKLDGFLE